jgi:hypothetical protein
MKKIDILNFITNSRKAPNDIKTYSQLLSHIGSENQGLLNAILEDLQKTRVVRETELNGERAYQVVAR